MDRFSYLSLILKIITSSTCVPVMVGSYNLTQLVVFQKWCSSFKNGMLHMFSWYASYHMAYLACGPTILLIFTLKFSSKHSYWQHALELTNLDLYETLFFFFLKYYKNLKIMQVFKVFQRYLRLNDITFEGL